VPRRRPCPRQAARRVPRDRSRRQSPLLRPPRRLRTQRSRCRNRYRGFVRPLRYAPARADVGRLVHDMVSRARRTRGPCGCTPESGAGKPPRDSTAGRMARRLHAISPTPPPLPILLRGSNPNVLRPRRIPGPVQIRDATAPDRPAIVRIARASFDRVYAYFAVRGLRHAWPFLVAEGESSIVGFLEGILFRGTPSIGYVYFVAVDPQARGMGSGRALVQESLRLFRSRGADRAFAAVPRANRPPMQLFE